MSDKQFDFIFIGAGAAGLQLVMNLVNTEGFKDSRILLLDKSLKDTNDRTWSFWEKGSGPYDHIAHKIWTKGRFYSSQNDIEIDMGGYSYKMLRAIDFYTYCREELEKMPNVIWKSEEVLEVKAPGVVRTDYGEYRTAHIFDSRIPEEFHTDTKSVKLLQHFLGWVVEFEEDTFDDKSFTMMDFRDKMPETCSFMYVLPFSKRKGLLEFTYFNDQLVEDEVYEQYIRDYLAKHFSGLKFTVSETEKGVIPMTTYDFTPFHTEYLTKIGTAGGWVKPSSGYSFKISQRYIGMVIENLKRDRRPSYKVATGKNRFYDSIFLGILKDQNYRGEDLFDNMYHKLPGHVIFKFLDEETSLSEDIRVMSKYANATFTKAFLRQLF